mgnify:CR=1 FL=1
MKAKEINIRTQKLQAIQLMIPEEGWYYFSGVFFLIKDYLLPKTFFKISDVLASGLALILASSFAT